MSTAALSENKDMNLYLEKALKCLNRALDVKNKSLLSYKFATSRNLNQRNTSNEKFFKLLSTASMHLGKWGRLCLHYKMVDPTQIKLESKLLIANRFLFGNSVDSFTGQENLSALSLLIKLLNFEGLTFDENEAVKVTASRFNITRMQYLELVRLMDERYKVSSSNLKIDYTQSKKLEELKVHLSS